ncbi:MAG: LTA synthase family protein [Erythrobacter sp.]
MTAALLALCAGLMITGAITTSAAMVAALGVLLVLVSNIKHRVLGEPLIFSDFALIGAVFQQPQFYLSALRYWQMAVLVAGLGMVLAALLWFSSAAIAPRGAGLVLAGAAALLLRAIVRFSVWDSIAASPDSHRDVATHGLIATLLVHWMRWRKLEDPAPCSAALVGAKSGQLVIIVQCESFTDPADIWGDPALVLPGLARARSAAQHSGRLMVHGFGAYTMRTEYGVLFGRGESALGLRKFDPFLTAHREASYSLARRLDPASWTCHFVHPHDLRFYRRDRLMPAAGFTSLIGEDAFVQPSRQEGRYVSDAAVADKIVELAHATSASSLIYAVTIANHGPWPASRGGVPGASGQQYLEFVKRSDAMLARLIDAAETMERPVILCFFGDHRPSIPGISEPGAERHTPYVLLNFGPDGKPRQAGEGHERDLTPAELHHLVLKVIVSGAGEG